MSEEWPSYHKGRRDHLQAVGVIALSFSAFERRLFALYAHHPERQNMPRSLIEIYYTSLNELAQLKAIRAIFGEYEKDPAALAVANNIVDYFDWCSDARNKILHSEPYPPLFGGEIDKLYLTKPISKREPTSTYMWLSLEELRDIADKIECGKRHSAAFSIYLRSRDVPSRQLPIIERALAGDPLPEPLEVPPKLKLSSHPQHGAMPDHLKTPGRGS